MSTIIMCEGKQSPLDAPHQRVTRRPRPHQGQLTEPPNQWPPLSYQETKVSNYLNTLSFPISSVFHSIRSTKDVPIMPSLIEMFEDGFGWIGANLNKFDHPCPSHIGIYNKVIPKKVLTMDLWHCSWSNTQSLRLIQIIYSVMPQRRCHTYFVWQTF